MSFDSLSHDRKTAMPALAVSIEVVTTVLLWMRVGSRFSTAHSTIGIDDILIFAAWVTGLGLTVAVLLGTEKFGLNRHIWDVPPQYYSKGGLMGFIVEILFFWSTCFTKVSVLMFYRRLVEGTLSQKFRYAIWAAIAFVIGYTISFFVVILVACDPVKAIWMQFDLKWRATNDLTCTPAGRQVAIAKLIGALSVVTDFYSVILPAALVMQIQISRNQKIGLFFIFGLGMLVVGAGIARTYYLGRVFEEQIDKTWWTWDVFLASIIECNVAIICACAPSVKALFGKHFKNAASRYGSRYSRYYGKGSYGSNSTASEAGNGSRATPLGPATELKVSDPIQRADSIRQFKASNSMRSHEYPDDYQQEVPVAYAGSMASPRLAAALPIPARHLFDTPLPPPPPNQGIDQPTKSFLVTPSPSDSSDDEIGLVSTTADQAASKTVSASWSSPADGQRRLSARSISPSALFAERPHPDPLMPSALRISPIQTIDRQERTKFPVI